MVARGWDSKSVEEQIASANARQGQVRVNLNPDQLEAERKRDSLQLQRTRVMKDLEKCQDARYRGTLETGLAYLDSQIALLDGK